MKLFYILSYWESGNMAVTLVVMDSRGSKLGPLYSELYNEDVRIFSYPGASLTRLSLQAFTLVQQIKPRLMIIMGGINDLTTRNRETRQLSLRFTSSVNYVDHIMAIINSTRVLMRNEFPNTHLSFAGIVGMDLNKYLGIPGSADCQSTINNSILDVNRLIAHNNYEAGAPHSYFTTKVHKWTDGTCSHRYSQLYDGLHPSETVLKHWAKNIHQMHIDIGGATYELRSTHVS